MTEALLKQLNKTTRQLVRVQVLYEVAKLADEIEDYAEFKKILWSMFEASLKPKAH